MFNGLGKFSNSKVLVVCNDAGASNLLLHITAKFKLAEYVLSGPAEEIYKNLNGQRCVQGDLNQIDKYDAIFLGANGSIGVDNTASEIINAAKKLNIPTYGIIDNWTNFKNRWEVNPDYVACTDIYAFLLGIIEFGLRIRLQKNEYLKTLKHKTNFFKDCGSSKQDTALFLCQIIESRSSHDPKFEKCLCSLKMCDFKIYGIKKLKVRPHPADSNPLCLELIHQDGNTGIDIEISRDSDLVTDIGASQLIIGFNTYSMYIARRLHKKVRTVKRGNWKEIRPRYKGLIYRKQESLKYQEIN